MFKRKKKISIRNKNQELLFALGDETRLLIFLTLLKNEEIGMRVPDISIHTHLSRPSISHHMKILKEVGLVNMYKIGTKNYYYVDINQKQFLQFKVLIDDICRVIDKAKSNDYPNIIEE